MVHTCNPNPREAEAEAWWVQEQGRQAMKCLGTSWEPVSLNRETGDFVETQTFRLWRYRPYSQGIYQTQQCRDSKLRHLRMPRESLLLFCIQISARLSPTAPPSGRAAAHCCILRCKLILGRAGAPTASALQVHQQLARSFFLPWIPSAFYDFCLKPPASWFCISIREGFAAFYHPRLCLIPSGYFDLVTCPTLFLCYFLQNIPNDHIAFQNFSFGF